MAVNPYAANNDHDCLVTTRFREPSPPTFANLDCRIRGSVFLQGKLEQWLSERGQLLGKSANDAVKSKEIALLRDTLSLGFDGLLDDCFVAESFKVFNIGKLNEVEVHGVPVGFGVEMAFPMSDATAATNAILAEAAAIVKSGLIHSAPISLRFTKASDAYMSPQFGGPTMMMEIEGLVGVKNTGDLLRHQQAMLLVKFPRCRPHWGLDLDSFQSQADVAARYPMFAAWKKQFDQFNSKGVFDSELTDRLQLSKTKPTLQSNDCGTKL